MLSYKHFIFSSYFTEHVFICDAIYDILHLGIGLSKIEIDVYNKVSMFPSNLVLCDIILYGVTYFMIQVEEMCLIILWPLTQYT